MRAHTNVVEMLKEVFVLSGTRYVYTRGLDMFQQEW